MKIAILGAGPAGLLTAAMISKNRAFRGSEIFLIDQSTVKEISERFRRRPLLFNHDPRVIGSLNEITVDQIVCSKSGPARWANCYSEATLGGEVLTKNVLTGVNERVRLTKFFYEEDIIGSFYGEIDTSAVRVTEVTGTVTNVSTGTAVVFVSSAEPRDELVGYDILINTLPLPLLMKLIGDRKDYGQVFRFLPTVTDYFDLQDDSKFNLLEQIIYYPDHCYRWTRIVNIRGRVSAERGSAALGGFGFEPVDNVPPYKLLAIHSVEVHGGFDALYQSPFKSKDANKNPVISKGGVYAQGGKYTCVVDYNQRFIPVNPSIPKSLIYDLTRTHKIYSVGRFATWKYRRIDQLPSDINNVMELIKVSKGV